MHFKPPSLSGVYTVLSFLHPSPSLSSFSPVSVTSLDLCPSVCPLCLPLSPRYPSVSICFLFDLGPRLFPFIPLSHVPPLALSLLSKPISQFVSLSRSRQIKRSQFLADFAGPRPSLLPQSSASLPSFRLYCRIYCTS